MAAVIDPILREIIRHRLMGAVGEMSETLKRAAYTPTIYEVLDFSNALHNPAGDVVAQALGIPIFLGAMSASCRAALETFGPEGFAPGDVIICNDPHLAGGTHVNDINVIVPIFHGDRVVLFAQSKAHWRDVGGKDTGSWSADANSIFQEGLRLPPVKLAEAGRMNEALLAVITANSRLPENARGDLMAQVAACQTGERRVSELIARYGVETLATALDAILDHGERLIRAEIEQIPDGTYTAEDWLDDDGLGGGPALLRIAVTVAGGEMTADFTGTGRQNPCGIANTVLAGTVSAVRMAVKCLTDPHLPANEGCYRPIRVVAPAGTFVNAQAPAPVTVGLGAVNHVIIEAVFRALAPVLPDRVIAGSFGSINAMQIFGTDPETGRLFIHGMPYAGGWGARAGKDGIAALQGAVNGDCRNVPAEIIETKYPLRVERFSLIPDSGGPGRTRGGLGVQTDYRLLVEGAAINSALIRYRFQPYGVSGGLPGHGNVTVVDEEQHLHRVSGFSVRESALVSHRMGGGGGYGPAWQRQPERVAEDVAAGYVTRKSAARDYGVALHPDLTVDAEETNRLRAEMRGSG